MAPWPSYFHPKLWQDWILLSGQIPLKALWQRMKHICWFQHTSCRMFCCLLAEPAWIHCWDQPEGAPWSSLSAQTVGLHSYKCKETESEEAEMQKEYCTWIMSLLLPRVTDHFPTFLISNLIKLALMKLWWMPIEKYTLSLLSHILETNKFVFSHLVYADKWQC